jgi:hypothetical protein
MLTNFRYMGKKKWPGTAYSITIEWSKGMVISFGSWDYTFRWDGPPGF